MGMRFRLGGDKNRVTGNHPGRHRRLAPSAFAFLGGPTRAAARLLGGRNAIIAFSHGETAPATAMLRRPFLPK